MAWDFSHEPWRQTLRSATIAINGAVQTFPPAITDHQQALLNALTQPRSHALSN